MYSYRSRCMLWCPQTATSVHGDSTEPHVQPAVFSASSSAAWLRLWLLLLCSASPSPAPALCSTCGSSQSRAPTCTHARTRRPMNDPQPPREGSRRTPERQAHAIAAQIISQVTAVYTAAGRQACHDGAAGGGGLGTATTSVGIINGRLTVAKTVGLVSASKAEESLPVPVVDVDDGHTHVVSRAVGDSAAAASSSAQPTISCSAQEDVCLRPSSGYFTRCSRSW